MCSFTNILVYWKVIMRWDGSHVERNFIMLDPTLCWGVSLGNWIDLGLTFIWNLIRTAWSHFWSDLVVRIQIVVTKLIKSFLILIKKFKKRLKMVDNDVRDQKSQFMSSFLINFDFFDLLIDFFDLLIDFDQL